MFLQHDAACRVIARLKIERDEARERLVHAERHVSAAGATPAVVPAIAPPVVASNGKRGMYFAVEIIEDILCCGLLFFSLVLLGYE